MRSGIRAFRGRCLAVTFVLGLIGFLCLLATTSAAIAQDSVCAEVRIEIRQKVSLERQAFDAILRIRNGLATGAVENVSVDVLFTDVDGNPVVASSDPDHAAATFFIRVDELDGIDALDGTGSVAAQSTGTVRWIIIPAADAGGNTPAGVMYMVGARLQYRLNGEDHAVDVVPETITVKPQPRFQLDYFLASDVYADDAFTPEIEPPVPFTLGVRLRNAGAGTGHNVSIESAQPEIVDNEQGLLVGFSIIGSHVDEQPAAPTLNIDFGDVPGGGVRMGRWLMETTLSGRFISMDASYTHADELGGALTSLIDGEPATHLLLRDVLVELPGRDGIRDFLARDGDVLRVYESNGVDSEVVDLSEQASLTNGNSGQEYSLVFPENSGFSYVRVADPRQGNSSGLSIARSSGQLLSAANVWYSKTRKPDNGWSYFINVFDVNGGGTYTVTVDAPSATGSLAGIVYADINGNGVRDADEDALDAVELSLTGTTASGEIQRTTLSQNDGNYVFVDLPEGTYSIAISDIASYENGTHETGSAGGVVEVSRISQISLGSGVAGTGYRFAKVPVDTQGSADLQVLPLEGQARVVLGEVSTLTFRVLNTGPQSALASTSLQLPSAFTVTGATPSDGVFSPESGVWEHGAMLPGQQQSLVLQGTFGQLGAQTINATVQMLDDGIHDPDSNNNHQSLEVLVEAVSVLSIVNEAAPISDILFLVSCPEDAAPTCVDDRIQRWQSLLAGTAIRHRIESDPTQFALALRSGEWRSVWVDGSAWLSEGTIAAEIRESVRRGGALIVSGTRDVTWERFEVLTGGWYSADLPADSRTIALLQSEYFEQGGMMAAGVVATFDGGDGRVLAEYAPGLAAVIATPVGAPAPVVVFGFDPLSGIETQSNPQMFMSGLASGAAIRMPDVVLGRSVLPFRVHAQRPNAATAALALAVGFPESFSLISADPDPTITTDSSLSWAVSWPLPEASFEADYILRAPADDGMYTILAMAQWEDEEAEASTAIQTRSTHGQIELAREALEHLEVPLLGDQALKAQAQALFAAAESAYLQGNQEAAIAALLEAIELLDGMEDEDALGVAEELSRALLAMSRDRPAGTGELFSDGFEEIL
ncbi:MAG: hypothetical protein KDI75_07110 [Xanthomonadales bacterium]|nr:hypothetical protein [Xanthomonadales bacterium]